MNDSNVPDSSLKMLSSGQKIYPSRVDTWIVGVVVVALALCFVQAWILRDSSHIGAVTALMIGFFSLAMVVVLTVPCRYTLENDHLYIRCGLINRRVPYADIHGVE